MISLAAAISALQVLNLLLTPAAALRLYALGAWGKYRVFVAYLIFTTLRSLLLLAFPRDSRQYFDLYIWSEPVLLVFYVALVLELFRLVLKDFPGIYTASRYSLTVALAIALTVSAAVSLLSWNSQVRQSRTLLYLVQIERGVVTSMFLFLILVLAFLAWFPVPLPRNVVAHCGIYALYFLGVAGGSLMYAVAGPHTTPLANLGLAGATTLALAGWIVLLNRAGEERRSEFRPHWNPTREQELVRQLESINSSLLRAARK